MEMESEFQITPSSVLPLIAWARLEVVPERVEILVKALPDFVGHAERLSQVDVSGVEPAFVHPLGETSE